MLTELLADSRYIWRGRRCHFRMFSLPLASFGFALQVHRSRDPNVDGIYPVQSSLKDDNGVILSSIRYHVQKGTWVFIQAREIVRCTSYVNILLDRIG